MAKTKNAKQRLDDGSPAFWDKIENEYQLDPAQRMLVSLGRQAWSRWQECRRRLDAEGLVLTGTRGRPRLNPLLAAEARTREALLKIVAQLNFGGD